MLGFEVCKGETVLKIASNLRVVNRIFMKIQLGQLTLAISALRRTFSAISLVG